MKKKRFAKWIALAMVFLQVILPLQSALANPSGLDDVTAYAVVHKTTDTPPTVITVTKPDSSTILPVDRATPPPPATVYDQIPPGSTLNLTIPFHMNEGTPPDNYVYASGQYFDIPLPQGINFGSVSDREITKGPPDNTIYARWSIVPNPATPGAYMARVTLADGVVGMTEIEGELNITGTFEAADENGEEHLLQLGEQRIIFKPTDPPPAVPQLEKSGVYDPADHTIEWTVTVNPPAGQTSYDISGLTLVDVYSDNQTYEGPFNVGGTDIPDANFSHVAATRTLSYTFPGATDAPLVITYKTKVKTFAQEGSPGTGGSLNPSVKFENTASLKSGSTPVGEDVTADITQNWIEKSGMTGNVTVAADGNYYFKWTVKINNFTDSMVGALIEDTLPAHTTLVTGDADRQIEIAGQGAVAAGTTEAGTYTLDGQKLTYRLAAGDADAGGVVTLTYYTVLAAADAHHYLDNNGAVKMSNKAAFIWGATGAIEGWPTDTGTTGIVGEGGLVSKSAGSLENYLHSTPKMIKWTIIVNGNGVDMSDPTNPPYIEDEIESGHELFIGNEGTTNYYFRVEQRNASGGYDLISGQEFTTLADSGKLTGVSANGFTYDLSDIGSNTYRITYYTKVTNWADFIYKNTVASPESGQTGNPEFTNKLKLYRNGGVHTTVTGTKQFSSQVLDKTAASKGTNNFYDYSDNTVEWKIVVNRNKATLTNPVVTDVLPPHMDLLIDAGKYKFVVTDATGAVVDTVTDPSALTSSSTPLAVDKNYTIPAGQPYAGETSTKFTYTFGSAISDQYTITFFAQMKESELNSQWSGTRSYDNYASLKFDENPDTITDTHRVQVRNPVVLKNYIYPAGSTSDLIPWSVVINAAGVRLQGGVVRDELVPELQYVAGSLELLEVEVSAAGVVAETGTTVPLAPGDVTYENNVLTVKLPPDTDKTYRINFKTAFVASSGNLSNFENRVTLTASAGPAGSVTAAPLRIDNLWERGSAGTNTLTIQKTNMHNEPVAGVTYQLFALVGGQELPIKQNGVELTETTNASGIATFSSLPGWVFIVREISAPPGYVVDPDPLTHAQSGERLDGTRTYTHQDNFILSGDDDGTVIVTKKSSGGWLLTGGLFELTGNDFTGQPITRMEVRAENGLIKFKNVPAGEYIIKEVTPPSEHARTDEEIRVVITPRLDDPTAPNIIKYYKKVNGAWVELTPNQVELINRYTPSGGGATISLTKTDAADGKRLVGAEFTLYDASGRAISTAVSDANGHVWFSNVPNGGYTIKETRAPLGYFAGGDPIRVNANGTLVDLTVPNTSMGRMPKTGDADGLMGFALLGGALVLMGLALTRKRREDA